VRAVARAHVPRGFTTEQRARFERYLAEVLGVGFLIFQEGIMRSSERVKVTASTKASAIKEKVSGAMLAAC
jgi:hypothetical protein